PQTAAEDSLETLMEAMGQLDLDDQGNWNYQGHGSTSAFVRGITQRLSDEPASDYCPWRNPPVQQWPNLTTTVCDNESTEHQTRDLFPLPSIDVAREMTVTALEDGCALFNFVHQPTFYAMFNRMYSIDMNQYGKDEVTFLPLLYAALAVGYLYSSSADGATIGTTNAISQGRKYFQACKELLDITECHHVWSLQALVFMIIYSQSSAKMATCHSYISAAIAASLQMGLHRSDPANLRHIEKETRKRLFWTIRTMETYIVSIMGLPRILSDADIDQEMPLEIEDKYITEASILPAPEGQVTKMTAVNAHTRLIFILAKIINEVYPAKRTVKQNMKSEAYTVQGSKIKEAELDLRTWTEHLPEVLMPCSNLVSRFKRTQRLLSLAYNHVQMFLYRPFLHYISKSRRSANLEELPYIYAAACVQTSRNVIQNMKSMEEACLLNGPYWFCSYTTFCATISLVFYKLETAQWGLKDAEYGRDVLYRLASKSPAAKKNSETLIVSTITIG
ncbi:fungal-specific transcription factor domain-containing protein, partial [Xylogone sp. PMI_703]